MNVEAAALTDLEMYMIDIARHAGYLITTNKLEVNDSMEFAATVKTLAEKFEVTRKENREDELYYDAIDQFTEDNLCPKEQITTRRFVSLNVDIVLDLPEDADPDTQEGQDMLRTEFIDYLQSAQHIKLSFEIGEEDDNYTDEEVH